MKLASFLSLRSKITLIVCFVVFSLGLGTYYSLTKVKESYTENTLYVLRSTAKNLTDALAAQLFERYGDVQVLALNPHVQNLDIHKAPGLLDSIVTAYGIYDLIVLVDKQGRFVASNTKDYDGHAVNVDALKDYDFSKEPWFKETLAGRFTADAERGFNGTFIEGFYFSDFTKLAFGQDRYYSSFSAQVKNEKGDVIGVITNRAHIKWIATEMHTIHKNLVGSNIEAAEFSVMDSKGNVFYALKPTTFIGVNEKGVYSVPEKIAKGYNLVEIKDQAAIMALKKDFGALFEYSEAEATDLAVGFAKVTSPKWPAALDWHVVVHKDQAQALAGVKEQVNEFYFILVIVSLICLAIATWIGVVISKRFNDEISELSKNSDLLEKSSKSSADQATELSEASTEQSAAIQETVAAVDEISAMVDKNADAAKKSSEMSRESRESAERGRTTVDEMLRAMDEISQANGDVTNQMNQSNQELSEITKMIAEIGSKTKVINEIVFQTKLLSFNASVEAARAGEAGKGFSVVAEEVGNLAQMSGTAAKEITELLDRSIKKVEEVVSQSKSRVERLMQESQNKVDAGSNTAKQCMEALDSILENVAQVDKLVSEISVASEEQALGVREISKAIAELERVTSRNAELARQSQEGANGLGSQARDLNGIVDQLVGMVRGESSGHSYATQSASHHLRSQSSTKHVPIENDHKVISFEKAKKSTPAEEVATHTPLKKVSGDHSVPNSDDPGFGDE